MMHVHSEGAAQSEQIFRVPTQRCWCRLCCNLKENFGYWICPWGKRGQLSPSWGKPQQLQWAGLYYPEVWLGLSPGALQDLGPINGLANLPCCWMAVGSPLWPQEAKLQWRGTPVRTWPSTQHWGGSWQACGPASGMDVAGLSSTARQPSPPFSSGRQSRAVLTHGCVVPRGLESARDPKCGMKPQIPESLETWPWVNKATGQCELHRRSSPFLNPIHSLPPC